MTSSHASDRQHYGLTFAVLAIAGLAYALMSAMVAPALPDIQRELGASPTGVAWVLTAFLLSTSIFTPIAGRLGDMFGKERMLIVTLGLLVAGSVVSALASSLNVLILGRVIQGVGGAVFPLAFGIIRDEFPRERIASGIALISAILGIGGGLGIVLAGPIVDNLSYHWLFWIPAIPVALALVAAIFWVPESPVKTPGKINYVGAALLSAWLVCLLVAVSEGQDWGWTSGRVIGLIVAAAVIAFVWVRNEQAAGEPLVDMNMMRIRGVWTVNAAALLIGAGMYSSFILIPQFVEEPVSSGYGFGASVTQAGLFMLPSTVMMLVVSPLAGRLSNTLGSRVPLMLGALVTTISFAMLAFLHAEKWEIYVGAGLMGIGIGLAFASLANLIVEAVPPQQTGVATGMNTVMRTIGGAIGSTIGAAVIAGTVVGSGSPTESGFTTAFAISAIACLLALLASLYVPRRPAAQAVPANVEAAPARA
ncbi:MFS transporter [Conexibacter sp. CPCC 206217]|uniref:MFS transporter n=1 Tax=Conexibacter sp. CPCC 206217 TaxID=3064574 RepID=UPI00271B45C8|nr:MFS transporter [Conexibacter sp. CPCC 206217]MDO8211138.1 MFS transporter [Conexibacter sp. CPCC 206217]